MDVQIGPTITNGASALRLTEKVAKDGRWGIEGWTAKNIDLNGPGTSTGRTTFLPDYLVKTWRPVAWKWEPLGPSGLEHRYVWSHDYRWLRHETRVHRLPVDCRSEHGLGQPDCPKCWRWSERNPDRVAVGLES